jgi:hypothetical protein
VPGPYGTGQVQKSFFAAIAGSTTTISATRKSGRMRLTAPATGQAKNPEAAIVSKLRQAQASNQWNQLK